MRRLILGIAIALAAFPFIAGLAQTHDDIEAGRKLAQKFCASCHAIGMTGRSAHPSAPPFRNIAAKGNVENLEEALAEGIVVGHPDMPQFKFKAENVAALIAYLKSLSGKG